MKLAGNIAKNEKAQATFEYIFVLAFSVMLFITVVKGVLMPAMSSFQKKLTQKINELYSGDNLHRLMFKRPN